MHQITVGIRGRWMALAAVLIAAGLGLAGPAEAQTRGILGYDSGTDSGFLRLFGTSGQSASRLWVASGGDDNRGILQLYDNGGERVLLMVDDASQGLFRLRGSGGNDAARLTVDNADDAGILWLYHGGGHVRAALEVDAVGQGVLVLDGSDNTDRARLSLDDDTDTGFLRLRGQAASNTAYLGRYSSSTPNNGRLRLYSSGSTRADLRVNSGTNAGMLVLRNGSGTSTITLNGATGDISKSGSNGFLVPHPKDPGKEIFYISLEGPERGMYVRGSANLKDGHAVVALPEHFSVLARQEGMTVQLTPNSADTYGLAAVRKAPSEVEVRELAGGKGSFAFDYVVFAARNDLPPLEAVRNVAPVERDLEPPEPDGDVGREGQESDTGLPEREPVDGEGVG